MNILDRHKLIDLDLRLWSHNEECQARHLRWWTIGPTQEFGDAGYISGCLVETRCVPSTARQRAVNLGLGDDKLRRIIEKPRVGFGTTAYRDVADNPIRVGSSFGPSVTTIAGSERRWQKSLRKPGGTVLKKKRVVRELVPRVTVED